jgi:hypothetical protein
MTALDIVCNGLAATHDADFREAMRPELQRRMLEFSPEDWTALQIKWHSQSLEWQFNLSDTLSPTRHGQAATAILMDMLLNGPEGLILTIAEKLVASHALDDDARDQIVTRIATLPQAGPHETTYRQQLLQQVLSPDTAPAIAEAAEFSIRNRDALSASSLAACYYCQTVFPTSEVTEFIASEGTALCPYCGIDAVLPSTAGYSFTEAQLRALNEFWF